MKWIWEQIKGVAGFVLILWDIHVLFLLRIPAWIRIWKSPTKDLGRDITVLDSQRAALKGFDLKPLKWLATAALLAGFGFSGSGNIRGVLACVLIFGVAYLSYFLFLLLRRISCGLLEWMVLTAVLGSVVGFIVSYPGMSRDWWTLSIFVTIAAGFVLESFVRGLSWILILNTTQPLMRVLLLLSSLGLQSALAFWVASILSLFYRDDLVPMVGNKVLALGPVFLVLAVLTTGTGIWVWWQLRKVKAELKPISA